jgi:hypothetical protein
MDSRPGDETLLLAVAERDMGAFRTLYERHAGWLAIRLARRCNDRDLRFSETDRRIGPDSVRPGPLSVRQDRQDKPGPRSCSPSRRVPIMNIMLSSGFQHVPPTDASRPVSCPVVLSH